MDGTRLLVVEDHPLFRQGFLAMAAALRPGWKVGLAGCATTVADALAERMPDAVIIDVGLGSDDGIVLAAKLRRNHGDLPILIMSGDAGAAVRRRALAAGASGFVGKDESAEDMASAIDAVLAGGRHFPATDGGSRAAPALTARQAEVLTLLAEGHGNKEMRFRLGIAERTVRAHLTELFHALGVSSRTQALIRARDVGLIG